MVHLVSVPVTMCVTMVDERSSTLASHPDSLLDMVLVIMEFPNVWQPCGFPFPGPESQTQASVSSKLTPWASAASLSWCPGYEPKSSASDSPKLAPMISTQVCWVIVVCFGTHPGCGQVLPGGAKRGVLQSPGHQETL